MPPSKCFSLLSLDFSPGLQVTEIKVNEMQTEYCIGSPFISDEHDNHVAVSVFSDVPQPGGQVVEGLPPGYVVHKERPCGRPVVGAVGAVISLEVVV